MKENAVIKLKNNFKKGYTGKDAQNKQSGCVMIT